MSTKKVAVLGGGMGALAAAWRLAQEGGYDITVYQRGWRLGGKGASGRNAEEGDRIEEHGLHILMGFYDRAFTLLKACYDMNPPTTHGQLIPWGVGSGYTFTAWDHCAFSQQWQGDWDFWEVKFPVKAGNPWDGNVDADFTTIFQEAVNFFFTAQNQINSIAGPLQQFANIVTQLAVNVGMITSAHVKAMLIDTWNLVGGLVGTNKKLRWWWMAFSFAGANLIGLLDAGMPAKQIDFSALDASDYKAWLKKNLTGVGCPDELGGASPLACGIYDLVFASGGTLGAGVALYGALRMALGYRGHVAYKMNAGMGDIVFAPLYLALAKLGVKFRFFHRVKALRVTANEVTSIEIEKQVAFATNVADYDPLRKVGNHPCWPNRPDEKQLSAQYQTDFSTTKPTPPFDFENDDAPSPYSAGALTLNKGSDFEFVVLGIPLGALGAMCDDLANANPGFKAMCTGVKTIGTQALQIWLGPNKTAFPAAAAHGTAISYVTPFNSGMDMSQVVENEGWPANGASQVVYFCDALTGPANWTQTQATQQVGLNATAFLGTPVTRLLPAFKSQSVVSQYSRANWSPSERYVLSEAGCVKHRLAPDKSGFTNLALAGDWVQTPLNVGCLEAATYGGLAAADSIILRTYQPLAATQGSYVERDGDWVLRPLGKLESVSMWIFVLRAGAAELNALCDRYVNHPTGNTVTAAPYLASHPFVLLVCANLAKIYSDDVDDKNWGWMPERDVGFFVPITLTANGASHLSNLIPYLFVDNFPAVLSGREIFGFPKVLGKIDAVGDPIPTSLLGYPSPMQFTVTSNVVPLGSTPAAAVTQGVVIDVKSTKQKLATAIPDVFTTPISFIASKFLSAITGSSTAGPSFATIPMVFLKEFRAAKGRTAACYQSVVTVEAELDALHGGAMLYDDFDITLPQYDSIHIAKTLGLGAGPTFHPIAAVSVKIDFSLPFGDVLWP